MAMFPVKVLQFCAKRKNEERKLMIARLVVIAIHRTCQFANVRGICNLF